MRLYLQLFGTKGSEIEAKDAKQQYAWDAQKLLEQIVTVYLNLAQGELEEQVTENMVQDEVCDFRLPSASLKRPPLKRSYNPETFAKIVAEMLERRSLPMTLIERFRNLTETAQRHHSIKQQIEIDFGLLCHNSDFRT